MIAPCKKPFILAFLLILPLSLSAQEDGGNLPPGDQEKIVPQWQKTYENLGAEKQQAYRKHMAEASRLFRQKRIIEALNSVGEAQRVFPEDPSAFNLIGACQVEFRSFDKAREAFERALLMQSEHMKNLEGVQGDARIRRMAPVINILFNLAEMDFVTKRWQACHDRIEKILPDMDPGNTSMIRLMEFKYLICKIKLDKIDDARALAGKYDYLDDYPFYYYANAALAYHDEKEEEAERWRGSARRVFRSPAVLAPWEDTMIEVGYVKSFYGGS